MVSTENGTSTLQSTTSSWRSTTDAEPGIFNTPGVYVSTRCRDGTSSMMWVAIGTGDYGRICVMRVTFGPLKVEYGAWL